MTNNSNQYAPLVIEQGVIELFTKHSEQLTELTREVTQAVSDIRDIKREFAVARDEYKSAKKGVLTKGWLILLCIILAFAAFIIGALYVPKFIIKFGDWEYRKEQCPVVTEQQKSPSQLQE